MESRASLSNNWRSAWEYSQVSGETSVRNDSDCGDIVALPPAGQHKGTPLAALYSVTVNLPPEADKIIDGRTQRERHHYPNRGQRNRVDREIEEVPGQVRPVMVNDGRHHREDLHEHLGFA